MGARYLSFLSDLDNIGTYAWGAGMLAHMHTMLSNFSVIVSRSIEKRVKKRRLGGHVYSLMILVVERIPQLWKLLIEGTPIRLPHQFPLIKEWAYLLHARSENSYHKMSIENCLETINNVPIDEVVWRLMVDCFMIIYMLVFENRFTFSFLVQL